MYTCKVEAVKQWMASLQKEIKKKDHNSAEEREEADILGPVKHEESLQYMLKS
jgi:hypothetical protein